MIKYILFFILITGLLACSVERKLARNFEGEGREKLFQEFGEPFKIVNLENGNQRFIYIKESFIKETEIGTGRFTMDTRMSPSFIKEETYKFDIDKNGFILETYYEKKKK